MNESTTSARSSKEAVGEIDSSSVIPRRLAYAFSPGEAPEIDSIDLLADEEAQAVVQKSVLARWPDGSIRWCLLECEAIRNATLTARVSRSAPGTPQVSTGSAKVASRRSGSGMVLHLGKEGPGFGLVIRLSHGGAEYLGRFIGEQTTDAGPIRWRHIYQVEFVSEQRQQSSLLGDLAIETYRSEGLIVCELQLRNPSPMDHPGGNWDLGAAGNVLIEDFSIALTSDSAFQSAELELLDSGDIIKASKSIDLYQASSGGENWNSSNHVDREQKFPLPFKGFRLTADERVVEGSRARPLARFVTADARVSVVCDRFWEEFPKRLTIEERSVRLALFPAESTTYNELQGGEQKTFRFSCELTAADEPGCLATFVSTDTSGTVTPARDDSPWPYLQPRSSRSNPAYEALVDLAIKGDDTFASKSETIDQYGWRNFGDIWGDHEAVFHPGETPMISHYNNQYDCVLGFGIHYLRTGDRKWWDLMIAMADHAWDIDTYHCDGDKLLYNGGLFWHTYHYADAHTSTHRSYPKRLRVSQSFDGGTDLSELGDTGEKLTKTYQIGGGPAAAHNYNTGWMLAYFLTGNERYRIAAISAADYVMRIDDGSKTPFRWLSRSDTGYSTCSSEGYYGPGRAPANSTHALLTGHELTGDRKYLDRAAILMRRTVHPNQDLEALDLLNAELRWFYTMYLQALGRYVDYKLMLRELDADFRYGVAALRHYANWMAEHERPTLAEPDKLQYPTETWAAQDMRKWHILEHAARYAPDVKQRESLHAKADFFFDYVVDYLSKSPTKSLCRPVILMLNFGWQRDWMRANRQQPAFVNEISDDFGEPAEFTPQRAIAISRFKKLVVLGMVSAVGIISAGIYWLIG